MAGDVKVKYNSMEVLLGTSVCGFQRKAARQLAKHSHSVSEDHSTCRSMGEVGATYRQLEEEPEALRNSAPSLREQVEKELKGPNGPPTNRPLPPIEPTEIQVGVFTPTTTHCCH